MFTNQSHTSTLQQKHCNSCQFYLQIDHFPKKGNGRTESLCKKCFNLKRQSKRAASQRWNVLNLPVRIFTCGIKSNWTDVFFSALNNYNFLLSTDVEINVDDILNRSSKFKSLLA